MRDFARSTISLYLSVIRKNLSTWTFACGTFWTLGTHPRRYSEHIRGDFRKNHRDGRFTSLTMAATKSRGAWNWILGRSTHPRAYSRLPSINPLPSNSILPVSFLVRVSAHLRGEGKESVKSRIWTFNLKLRKPLKHIRTFRLLLLSSRVKVISWFRVEIPWDDRRDPSSSTLPHLQSFPPRLPSPDSLQLGRPW